MQDKGLKPRLERKLKLERETIRALTIPQQRMIEGGIDIRKVTLVVLSIFFGCIHPVSGICDPDDPDGNPD